MDRLISADKLREDIIHDHTFDNDTVNYYLDKVDGMETEIEDGYELRILKNYLHQKPKTYRDGNANYVVVRDLLMTGTHHAGMTSCIEKCRELGIDPYGCDLDTEATHEQ